MQAIACPQVLRAALARPLTRGSRQLAAHIAPWPQRQTERAGGSVAVRARNRLADLLADMKAEDVEEDSTTPIGKPLAAACRLPPVAAAPRQASWMSSSVLPF